MKKITVYVILALFLVSCDKDKFETKPHLKILTDGNVIIPAGSGFNVDLEFTDKEGDVDDSIFVRKERLNKRVVPTVRNSFWLKIPDFPDASKGEITLNLEYQNHLISATNPLFIPGSSPPTKEPDTLNLKFIVMDKEKNKSDTVTLNNVIVERN